MLTFHSHEREVSSLPLLIFQSRNGSYQMTQWRNLSQTLYNSPISTFWQAAIMKAQTQRSCPNLSIISIASILFYCAGFLRTEMELSNQRKKITALEHFVHAMKVHEGLIQGTPAGRYCKGTVLFVDLEKLSLNFPSLSLAICHNLCHPFPFLYLRGLLLPFRSLSTLWDISSRFLSISGQISVTIKWLEYREVTWLSCLCRQTIQVK